MESEVLPEEELLPLLLELSEPEELSDPDVLLAQQC